MKICIALSIPGKNSVQRPCWSDVIQSNAASDVIWRECLGRLIHKTGRITEQERSPYILAWFWEPLEDAGIGIVTGGQERQCAEVLEDRTTFPCQHQKFEFNAFGHRKQETQCMPMHIILKMSKDAERYIARPRREIPQVSGVFFTVGISPTTRL